MTHLLLIAMTLLLSVVGFHRVYCFSGINACYLSLYKGVVESCVVVATEKGEFRYMPQFYLPLVERQIGNHLAVELAPYCRHYEVSYSQIGIPIEEYSTSLVITFRAKVDDLITVTKVASFAIERSPV